MSYGPQGMWLRGTGEQGKLGSAKAASSLDIRHLHGAGDEPRLGRDVGPWMMACTSQTMPDRGRTAGSLFNLPLQTSLIQERSGSRHDLGKLRLPPYPCMLVA